MIEPLAKCSAGLDVHKAVIVCTILSEDEQGALHKQTREYRSFREELDALASWLVAMKVEIAVMESTGVYWKSLYEALEQREVKVYVVNARYVKQVPGRKTDVLDSEWLAELARCGLLKPSFIPPRDLRELRLWTRYRQKLMGILGSEKNRLHKFLDDAGIRLGCVVSDIDGVSARQMIAALIAGKQPPELIAELAKGRLRTKQDQLKQALVGHISDRHRFLLKRIESHIQWLKAQLAEIDEQVVAAMAPYRESWQLLQTIPGIDQHSAAMLLAEMGDDMERFGSRERLSAWAGLCPGNNESAGKKRVVVPCEGIATSNGYSVKPLIAPEGLTANSKGCTKGL
jgi:transposase